MTKRLMPARKQILEEKAGWLTQQFCPEKGPVNLNQIAEYYKIERHYGDYNNEFEGLIVHRNGRFSIFFHYPAINRPNDARLRFSFAHELAHYFISTHRRQLLQTGVMGNKLTNKVIIDQYIEKEADFFAANLLMPAPWLTDDFARVPFSYHLIEQTAGMYEVSLSAMLNRYATLGPEPIMIVNSVDGKITANNHPNCSKTFPFHKIRNFATSQLPENSLAAFLHTQSAVSGFQQRQLKASDWFLPSAPGHLHRPLIETCFYYEGNHQITSVLHQGQLSIEAPSGN